MTVGERTFVWAAVPRERFEFRSQEENNMMLSFQKLVCDTMNIHGPGTDREPCRAGGGLLGGKDPAGRF